MSGANTHRSSAAINRLEEIPFEVLPPESGRRGPIPPQDSLKLSGKIANLLDRAFPVRGSGARFGLDPLLGLIPGFGDALAAGLGSIIVLEAMRLNAPRPLVLRMAGNLALNALVGSIPLVGDIFSFVYKSNMRNYALLKGWQTGEKTYAAKMSRAWLVWGCIGLMAVAAGICFLLFWATSGLWKLVTD